VVQWKEGKPCAHRIRIDTRSWTKELGSLATDCYHNGSKLTISLLCGFRSTRSPSTLQPPQQHHEGYHWYLCFYPRCFRYHHGRPICRYVISVFSVTAHAKMIAPPPPKTMTREYQEAMNEHLRSQNANPIVSTPLYIILVCADSLVRSLIGRLQRQGNGPVVIWTLDLECVVLWLWIMKNNTHCRFTLEALLHEAQPKLSSSACCFLKIWFQTHRAREHRQCFARRRHIWAVFYRKVFAELRFRVLTTPLIQTIT